MKVIHNDQQAFYDEMYHGNQAIREHYKSFGELIKTSSAKKLSHLQYSADKAQMAMGMTFNVYHDKAGQEKILHPGHHPAGLVPAHEWQVLEDGLKQRNSKL